MFNRDIYLQIYSRTIIIHILNQLYSQNAFKKCFYLENKRQTQVIKVIKIKEERKIFHSKSHIKIILNQTDI